MVYISKTLLGFYIAFWFYYKHFSYIVYIYIYTFKTYLILIHTFVGCNRLTAEPSFTVTSVIFPFRNECHSKTAPKYSHNNKVKEVSSINRIISPSIKTVPKYPGKVLEMSSANRVTWVLK